MATIFDKIKTMSDYQRADEEFQLKKQQAQAQRQGTPPAALQLANEYQKRIAAGDIAGANLLSQFAKTVDRGLQQTPEGTYVPMAGYGEALGNIGAQKKGMERQAEKDIDVIMNPQIAGGEAAARQAQEAAYAPKIAQGKEVGQAAGKKIAEIESRAAGAPNQLMLIQQARELLPKATSGLLQTGIRGAANIVGKSTDASKADRQLQVLSAALTGAVPRFEGPQGVLDVQLYKQAAGDVANPLVPDEDRLAALSTMEQLQNKYSEAAGALAPSQAEIAAEGVPNLDNRPTLDTVSPKDPRVLKARELGYSEQEIINYLGGR